MPTAGTALGDPIEVGAALEAQLPRSQQQQEQPLASVLHLLAAKSSVGHAEPASGLTGLAYAVQQVSAAPFKQSPHFTVLPMAAWS